MLAALAIFAATFSPANAAPPELSPPTAARIAFDLVAVHDADAASIIPLSAAREVVVGHPSAGAPAFADSHRGAIIFRVDPGIDITVRAYVRVSESPRRNEIVEIVVPFTRRNHLDAATYKYLAALHELAEVVQGIAATLAERADAIARMQARLDSEQENP